MDNFLFKIYVKLHLNHLHNGSKTIWFVLLIIKRISKTISLDCPTECYVACKTIVTNCLTGFLKQLPRQSSVIVWPSVLCQDNIFVLPKEMTSAKTIRLSDRLDACKTILICLAECILPRQSKIVWPNGFSKTIAIVLPKVNCLASY